VSVMLTVMPPRPRAPTIGANFPTMRTRRVRWSELSRGQRYSVVALSAVEFALATASLVDLARRPAERVRGPKALWALAAFVQPVGPLAYLALGRRKG
jgi:hypothetical protein